MRSFIIKELEEELEIVNFNYDLEGFHYKLKNNNSLKVKEIVIINPGLINSLISYHFNKKYKHILELYINTLSESDSDNSSGEALVIILDDIARLRSILIRKYNMFLSKKKEEQFFKKLKILENEIRAKIIDFRLIKEQEMVNNINIPEKSKSR